MSEQVGSIISFRDVRVEQDGFTILQNTSVDIKPGLTAIVGPSGSGKTTFANTAYGLTRPSTGEVQHLNVDADVIFVNGPEPKGNVLRRMIGTLHLESADDRQRAAYWSRHAGYVAQSPYLDPNLTAKEYVSLGHQSRGNRLDKTWVAELVGRLGLDNHMDKKPRQLSGGEQQRVSILNAFVHKPELVVADEPTSDLDVSSTTEVLEVFRDVVDETGASVIFVSHDIKAAPRADHVIQLQDGMVIAGS
jgi:putative ABC transport system ATP-binding protein